MKRTTKAIMCAVVMVAVCVGFAAATGSMETSSSTTASKQAAVAPAPAKEPTTDQERFVGTWVASFISTDEPMKYYEPDSTEIADVAYVTTWVFTEKGELTCTDAIKRVDNGKVLNEDTFFRTYVCVPETKELILTYSDGSKGPPKTYEFSSDNKTLKTVDYDGFGAQTFTKQ